MIKRACPFSAESDTALDRLDVHMVREFFQGEPILSIFPMRETPKPSVALLAKKLGVSESAIRARMRKLERFIPPSRGTLIVNPQLLGEEYGILIFDVSELGQKEKVIDELRLIDDMFIVNDYIGSLAIAIFLYSDNSSLERKIDLISKISSCGGRKIFTHSAFPRCDMSLSTTDLQIIKCRLEDMSRSHRDIAEILGISSRTVKRRLSGMVQHWAIMPLFSVDMSQLKDCLMCDLLVQYENEKSKMDTETAILSLVDDYLTFYNPCEGLTQFNIIVPSVPKAHTIADQVRGLRNVRTARIEFFKGRIELYDRMMERVERQIAIMEATNGRPTYPMKAVTAKTRRSVSLNTAEC